MKRMNLKTILLFVFFLILFAQTVLAASPQNISITPSSGSSQVGQTFTFTTTYSDPDGANDIRECYAWFDTQYPFCSRDLT